MKRIFKSLLLVLMFFIGTCFYSSATEICDDCEYLTDESSATFTSVPLVLGAPCNCSITYDVQSTKGYCEDGTRKIFHYKILRIDYDTAGECTCSLEVLVQKIQLDCIAKAADFFNYNAPTEPLWGGEEDNIHFEFPVCWYYVEGVGQIFHAPCPSTLWCCVEYKLDIGKNDNSCEIKQKWDSNTHIPDPYNCPIWPTITCEDYDCSDFALSQQIYYFPKLVVDDTEVINELNLSSIKPNPVTNDYELNFSSDFTGDITIIISDNLGNEVQRISHNKQSGELVLPLSSEQLVSGSYFYRILAGERTLASGSFTVIK